MQRNNKNIFIKKQIYMGRRGNSDIKNQTELEIIILSKDEKYKLKRRIHF